jgi:hypothetical protein
MRLPKCPKNEALFELVSIPEELSFFKRGRLKWHLRTCVGCEQKAKTISETWSSFITPEPEVTTSLLKVYSRLQNDETLILKGWKLNQARPRYRSGAALWLAQGWLFRGGVAAAIVTIVTLVFWTRNSVDEGKDLVDASAALPFAQIRVEDKNRIQVHYVQPELLNSIEFETTGVK